MRMDIENDDKKIIRILYIYIDKYMQIYTTYICVTREILIRIIMYNNDDE